MSLATEQTRLPCEVMERIIDQSADDPEVISSFSLTCRQLCHRSRYVRFVQLGFNSGDHVLAFVRLLQESPHVRPLVRSMVIQPDVLSSFPLLHMLPRLSEIVFRPCWDWNDKRRFFFFEKHPSYRSSKITLVYQSSLIYFRRFGIHIQSLQLHYRVSFKTALPFVRLLLAFPNIAHLTCIYITVEDWGDREHLDLLRLRLSKQMRLKTLTFGFLGSSEEVYVRPNIIAVTLGLKKVEGWFAYPARSMWSQLQRLEFHFQCQRDYSPRFFVSDTVELLEAFLSSTLKEVTVTVDQTLSMRQIFPDVGRSETGPRVHDKLEKSLLNFPKPKLVWNVGGPLRLGRNSFWACEFRRQFPVLSQHSQCSAVMLEPVPTDWPIGHSRRISALVVSPDSKWVASACDGSIITLWDAGGRMVSQRVGDDFDLELVKCLAFSPDSRYLLCGGHFRDSKIAIWDLNQGAHNPIMLEGHDGTVSTSVWHPNGRIVASGSDDKSVRLWDVQTRQQLCILGHHSEGVQRVIFSFDGLMLASMTFSLFQLEFYLWDTVSGTLHAQASIPRDECDYWSRFIFPTFHLESVPRFATWSPSNSYGKRKIWDTLTSTPPGKPQLAYPRRVAFSPDGKLLATKSLDESVRIWDSHSGRQLCSLEGSGPGAVVDEVYFSSCGNYVTAVLNDKQSGLRLWSTSDGKMYRSPTLLEDLYQRDAAHVAFSPDGKTMWLGGHNGAVYFQRMKDIVDAVENSKDPL